MDMSDLLYRAFCDYRKNTREERECKRSRRALSRADTGAEAIEFLETELEIEDDWIDAIEEGLVHVGKAIEEERQFIRSNGEVVPIEKVKSVSRESAEHLARHGNLITRRQEGEDIVPDKIYTVERLNDYAVYENRFLYMLLCYLRDFVSYRYGKIAELANTYHGKLEIGKVAETGGRRLSFSLKMEEERKNDVRMSEKSAVKEKLDRIDGLLKTVHLYLGTPLMEELAKVPVLKPPVTETNVLKMDKNFKGAMRLYYFIAAYEGDGFTVKQHTRSVRPFPDAVADEFAEAIELCSFLTYEHGMGIEEDLARVYAEQERKRREEEARKERERLDNLKMRIRESGKGAEEYMLLLERRNRSLEKDSASLKEAKAEIGRLKEAAVNAALAEEAAERALQESHSKLIAKEKEHREEREKLEKEFEDKIVSLEAEQREAVRLLSERHDERVRSLCGEWERKYKQMEEAHEEEEARLKKEGAEIKEKLDLSERQRERAERETERLGREKTLESARLNAVKKEYGAFAPEEDFTSREQFDEIERQYRVFREFFKSEWRKAKKRIRKETMRQALAPDSEGESSAKADKEEDTSGET